MNRLYDLEDIIKREADEAIRDGKALWLWSFIPGVLKKLLNDSNVCPFTMSNNAYTNGHSIYTIKAKGTSTKLIKIDLTTSYLNTTGAYHYGSMIIEDVVVTTESRLITDLQSFIDYGNDRIVRLKNQADKKTQPFRQELSNLGINVKDFVRLSNIFNRLDYQNRMSLLAEGKEED